jgi:hypothetical protein
MKKWGSGGITPQYGRAIAQALVVGFPPRRPGFEPESVHVGFVVDKVALGQVFSEYLGFPCPSSFHQLLHNHNHHHHHRHLSSGAGTYNRPVVVAVPSGLSLTPLIIIILDLSTR